MLKAITLKWSRFRSGMGVANGRGGIAAFACLFYLFALCMLAALYLNGRVDTFLFFNSDALFLPSFFKNTLGEGNSFYDWILPPSPYLFPDALLYALAYFSSSQVLIQILVFAVLQSLLFFFLVAKLLAFFEGWARAIAHAALVSSSVVLLGLYSPDPFGLSFVGVFHFGSLLAVLLLAILYFNFLAASSPKEARTTATWAFIIAGSAAVSDRLVLIHFILPVLLIGAFQALRAGKNNDVLKFGILLLGGSLLASIIGKVFLPELGRLEAGFGLGSAGDKFAMLVAWIMDRPLWSSPIVLLFPLGLLAAFAYCYRHGGDVGRVEGSKKRLAVLFLVSAAVTLLFVGLSDRAFTSRYILPFLFLPGVVLFAILNKRLAGWLALLYLCTALLALIPLYRSLDEKPNAFGPPGFVQCVDEHAKKHGVSKGIASYWDAIPLYVLNDSGLKVVPVVDDLTPMRWMYNKHGADDRFSFAVVDDNAAGLYKISRTEIERRLAGKPIEYRCGDKALLIFDDQKLALPQESSISGIRSGALESFVKNPRALLVMAEEASKQGRHQRAQRLVLEAMALLQQAGANEETIRRYAAAKERIDAKANN